MPTLRDIRLRIRGIQSTQKITKAMKTMALVRLQKQEQRTRRSRPFSETVEELLELLAENLPEENVLSQPYFTQRQGGAQLWVVFTSDRGLCGSFNSNLLRQIDAEYEEAEREGRKIELIWVGLKGVQHAGRREYSILAQFTHLPPEPTVSLANLVLEECRNRFLKGQVNEVHLIYNHFTSIVKREIRRKVFLPIEYRVHRHRPGELFPIYLFEPSADAILEKLLPLYLETTIYQTLLESNASEYAARMLTMDQATNNAQTLIGDLTLVYHKARQASITREIIEVVSGAESLS